jgi:N-acetyl-gamma-glutamyl-phosphate reductase
MLKVKIIGTGGYGGVGITELLLGHPEAEIVCMVDPSNAGKSIGDVHPHLDGLCSLVVCSMEAPEAQEPADVVFMATPDKVGMELAPVEIEKGAKVIDYSGDFRFNHLATYEDYASRLGLDVVHQAPDLLKESVYGLSELRRESLNASTRVVGNPGCFAVSALLGMAPAAKSGMIDLNSIIFDAKTGVSGAGKTPRPSFHYPARYENMNAYRLSGHQHVCEIEHELARLSGYPIHVTFTAQVVPICRGIMTTCYAKTTSDIDESALYDMYVEFYKNDPFVRVYPSDKVTGTVHVRESNYCNLVVSHDPRTGTMRIVSHIDNLMKGQAGSALQNMNLLFDLDETLGLALPGRFP